jgi:hypothetical protein
MCHVIGLPGQPMLERDVSIAAVALISNASLDLFVADWRATRNLLDEI